MQLHKSDRLLLAVVSVCAIIVAVLAAVFVPAPKKQDKSRQPSTFLSTPDGARAAYLALRRLDFPTTRLRRPIDNDTLAECDALVILRPIVALTPYEVDVLARWVRGGKRLLLAPATTDAMGSEPDPLRLWFHFANRPEHADEPSTIVPVSAANEERSDMLAFVETLPVERQLRFTPGAVGAGPLTEQPIHEFWSDEDGVVAARIELGEGEIIALADVTALTNRGLREADSPVFLANLARELAGRAGNGRIAIDEYHAGFPQHDESWFAMLALVLSGGWAASVVQLLVVAALALYASGVRFGRPIDLVSRRRRNQTEFIIAGGRLLDDGGAVGPAHETLLRYTLRRIRTLLHIPERADIAAIYKALNDQNLSELAGLITKNPLADRRAARQHLFEWSSRVEKQMETLEHGN